MGLSRTIQQAGLVLMLLLCTNIASAITFLDESLNYRAFYKGVFSAQKEIGIADVTWDTSSIQLSEAGKPAAIETRMTVSSEDYKYVETLYPFRLVHRSLSLPDPVRSIAYEKYDSTERHGRDLTWLNDGSGVVLRFREGYQPDGKANRKLPAALQNWGSQQDAYQYYDKARHTLLSGMVDRMALLQRIREEELSVGARYNVPVTDGKYQYLYRVHVVSEEPLVAAGREWNALKIKFYGYQIEDGTEIEDHKPLLVWLDNTPRRTPLRIEYRNVIGHFVINLQAIDT